MIVFIIFCVYIDSSCSPQKQAESAERRVPCPDLTTWTNPFITLSSRGCNRNECCFDQKKDLLVFTKKWIMNICVTLEISVFSSCWTRHRIRQKYVYVLLASWKCQRKQRFFSFGRLDIKPVHSFIWISEWDFGPPQIWGRDVNYPWPCMMKYSLELCSCHNC